MSYRRLSKKASVIQDDHHLYKHNHPVTPSQVENIVDLGYPGVQKDFPTVKSVLPVKILP